MVECDSCFEVMLPSNTFADSCSHFTICTSCAVSQIERKTRGVRGDALHCPACDRAPAMTLRECFAKFWHDDIDQYIVVNPPTEFKWSTMVLVALWFCAVHVAEWVPMMLNPTLRVMTIFVMGVCFGYMKPTFEECKRCFTPTNVALTVALATAVIIFDPQVVYAAWLINFICVSMAGDTALIMLKPNFIFTWTRVVCQLLDLTPHGSVGYLMPCCTVAILMVSIVVVPAVETVQAKKRHAELARNWTLEALADARVRMEWALSSEARQAMT